MDKIKLKEIKLLTNPECVFIQDYLIINLTPKYRNDHKS